MHSLDRISDFIRSYIEDDKGKLGEIYRKAVQNNVPVIRPETREFLKTQLIIKKPSRILEVGTAVGYSALYMSGFIDDNALIDTIELSDERVQEAEANIKSMGKQDVIRVHHGDAAEVLKTLEENTYDFAFVDAAKGQYIFYLPEIIRVMKSGGVIISDNILQDGDVTESHFLVEKRNRTIHDRMREYLYTLTHSTDMETAILPVGDGVAVSIMRNK